MSKPNQPTDLEDIAGAISDLGTNIAGTISDLSTNIASTISDLSISIDERFDQVNNRFDKMDDRFERVESDIRAIRREQTEMREWMERIDSRLMGVESDIKEIYDKIVAIDNKFPNVTEKDILELSKNFEIIIDWAKEVSKKTGVPLPHI